MIRTCGPSAAGPMADEFFASLAPRIRRHPWWRARTRLVLALLRDSGIEPPARVLDAGCGWGTTLAALEGAGYRATGLDVSRAALEGLDRPGRRLVEADLSRPLPPLGEQFDAVLALDVIEHLDDDRLALRSLVELLAPEGCLIVSVPALPELFSDFDAVQGHRRRYLPETLAGAFAGSGASVERIFWWGERLVPMLRRRRPVPPREGVSALERYWRHVKAPPWPLSLGLELLLAMESRRSRQGKSVIGSSLFALARAPHRS